MNLCLSMKLFSTFTLENYVGKVNYNNLSQKIIH